LIENIFIIKITSLRRLFNESSEHLLLFKFSLNSLSHISDIATFSGQELHILSINCWSNSGISLTLFSIFLKFESLGSWTVNPRITPAGNDAGVLKCFKFLHVF